MRPVMMMARAPDLAKESAVAAPMPLPPSVIITILPLLERAGLVGETAG